EESGRHRMTATVRDPSVPRKVFVTRFTGDPSVPDMQSRHFSCAGFRAVDRDELRTCLALTPTHACSIESIGGTCPSRAQGRCGDRVDHHQSRDSVGRLVYKSFLLSEILTRRERLALGKLCACRTRRLV